MITNDIISVSLGEISSVIDTIYARELSKPPRWFPNAVATPDGWTDPQTGEVLVAIRSLNTRASDADIMIVASSDKYKVQVELERYREYFRLNDVVTIDLVFDERVLVNGNPQIAFHVGNDSTSRYFNYLSGSGTYILKFTYVVNVPLDGNAIFDSYGVTLTNGTITDIITGDTYSALDSLTFITLSTTLLFDSVVPTVISLTPLQIDGLLETGDVIDFEIEFDKEVIINGIPRMVIMMDNEVRYAGIILQTNPRATRIFRYVIEDSDVAEYGQVSISNQLDINDATITDIVGNQPQIPLSIPSVDTSTVRVNADPPVTVIQSVSVPSGVIGVGSYIDIYLTFPEIVEVLGGTPRVSLNIGGYGKRATYINGSGTTVLHFRYTISATDSGVVTFLSPLCLFGSTVGAAIDSTSDWIITYPPYSLTVSSSVTEIRQNIFSIDSVGIELEDVGSKS